MHNRRNCKKMKRKMRTRLSIIYMTRRVYIFSIIYDSTGTDKSIAKNININTANWEKGEMTCTNENRKMVLLTPKYEKQPIRFIFYLSGWQMPGAGQS